MNSGLSSSTPQQPQILLQLRQKSSQLRELNASLKDENKQMSHSLLNYSDRLDVILREKEIQERKSRSLMLLVTDLQRQIDDTYMEMHHQEEPDKLDGQNKALREILVKISELVKEDQKLLSFLRQAIASGPKATEFVQRSRYLEGQSELLAKLKSQISSFANENLQCSRKWNDLDRQSKRLEKQQGLFRIQTERIKRDLRQHYEDYLQRLNRSKAALVNFNQTQREKVIIEYMIEEVALLQEKRLSVQEQYKDLKHHQESLLEENQRIKMENRELSSFFTSPNSNEEHRLATKMKIRIQELRDYLAEVQQLRNLPQLPLSSISQVVRSKLKQLEESQCYIEKKIKDEQQGKMVIEQKDVITFFEGVLRGRDQRIQIAKQRQIANNQKLRELSVKRQLLSSQIQNLQQGLKYHSYQHSANRIAGTSSIPPVSGDLSKIDGVSRWKDRKMNATNLLTTTSKFVV